MSEYDTMFSFPSVDDEPDTELGVLLMGFGPERLLAGLGVAAIGEDDPATATQIVDQLRHDARPDLTMAGAITAGAARWRIARPAVESVRPGTSRSAALRQLWAGAWQAVAAAGELLGTLGRAERVYLTACWLRRTEIDTIVEADWCRT